MELEVAFVVSFLGILFYHFVLKTKNTTIEKERITKGEEQTTNTRLRLPSIGFGEKYGNLLVDEYGDLFGSGHVVGQDGDGSFIPIPFEQQVAQIVVAQSLVLILDTEGSVWRGIEATSDLKFVRIPFAAALQSTTVEKRINFLAADESLIVAIDEDSRLWEIPSRYKNPHLLRLHTPYIHKDKKVRSATCGGYGVLLEMSDGYIYFTGGGYGFLLEMSGRYVLVREDVFKNEDLRFSSHLREFRSSAAYGMRYCLVDNEGVVWVSQKTRTDFRFVRNGLCNILSVCAGSNFFVALDCEGNVWVWGQTTDEFFSGLPVHLDKPTLVPSLPLLRAISVGARHCTGITVDGRYVEACLFHKQVTELPFLPPLGDEFSLKKPIKSARFV